MLTVLPIHVLMLIIVFVVLQVMDSGSPPTVPLPLTMPLVHVPKKSVQEILVLSVKLPVPLLPMPLVLHAFLVLHLVLTTDPVIALLLLPVAFK